MKRLGRPNTVAPDPLDALLRNKLKGSLPTLDDMRALQAGTLSAAEAQRIRKVLLRSPRLLAQYAALLGQTVDQARQLLQA